MKNDVNSLQDVWMWENYINKDYSDINQAASFSFFPLLQEKGKKKTSIKPFPGDLIPDLKRDAKHINSLKITDELKIKKRTSSWRERPVKHKAVYPCVYK